VNSPSLLQKIWLPATAFILFLTAVFFRPLLPIDETRYMSVAWEMYLNHGWFKPLTMNFEPYHHKPPLLFWLINLSWSVFGVSRWAGLIPLVLASLSCVYLTGVLGRLLFPSLDVLKTRLIMAASLPFLMYGTLVMFDLTLCVFVLLSLVSIIRYAQLRQARHILLIGLFMGMGVLAKGPVAYLYILPVFLTAPLWAQGFTKPARWYAGCVGAILLSAIPVLSWLIPVLSTSSNDFAFWLVWNQTAGRVTGNFSDAHIRPIYFYLPLVPVLFMPWVFFPAFWRGIKNIDIKRNDSLRFLLLWVVPVFLAFSVIEGKQPHYLIPLLPGVILFIAFRLQNLEVKYMARVLAGMIVLFVGGHAVASQTMLKHYDLQPIADIIKTQPDRDLAFVRNYHAEIGFLARRAKPVYDLQRGQTDDWFKNHPDGWAIIRYADESEISGYKAIVDMPYRGKHLGIFEKAQ
jgi:4-amino-4-deoxy-L-arabinose transferase-like glycosyltransferase